MGKFLVNANWNDAPHLTSEQKFELSKTIRPHQRAAREKGMPVLGAGAIYPLDEEMIKCKPFQIPVHWRKAYALDVGWNRTAALWGAHDLESDVVYIYSEHYVAEEKPPVHADAIKARGAWMFGVVDPASRGRTQTDGERLFTRYTNLGLKLALADNSIDAGLDAVWERLTSGRLKIFDTCYNFFYEYRLYRRDEKGKIVKKDDHLMDTMRYLIVSGLNVAIPPPGVFGNRAMAESNHKFEWDPIKQLLEEAPKLN